MPHSADREYAERAIPQYEQAIKQAGGEPVRIPLDQTPAQVMKLIERCDGVLLPGSNADVDPAKFGVPRSPHTAAADPRRDTVDELLLQDAYNMRKPVFGICYGLQSLNVWRTGTLEQSLPAGVNHNAGRRVAQVHPVRIDPLTRLAGILRASGVLADAGEPTIAVNSSHRQAAGSVGDGLRVAAWSPEDGVKEAIGKSPLHRCDVSLLI